ncbi:MAG: hypothetical protein E7530_02890 [Ruminococcaceae bacterium]|nr:hypothetical protein [Oscillospiraceae bacterium]
MNAELHKQLKDISKVFEDLAKYEQMENQVKAHTKQYYNEYEKLKKKGFSAAKGNVLIVVFSIIFTTILLFLSIGILFFFLSNVYDASTTSPGGLMLVVHALLLFPLILLPFEIVFGIKIYRRTICKKKNDKLQAEAQKYYDEVFIPVANQDEKKYNAIIEDKEKYIAYYKPLLCIIPSDYLKYRAVTFFEEVVRTGRADTLKEAMNLYEEQVHRWNLEAQGERMIQQQHYDNLMMQIQLCDIEIAQSKNAATLRSIESMEFYNTFCR